MVGHLNQIREVLDGMSTASGPRASPPVGLEYLQGVAKGFERRGQELKDFEIDFKGESRGRTDANGRPKVPKIRWARHLTTIMELRGRAKQGKQELAHALYLLQTKQM
jgi:hypothetical protein